MSACFCVSVFVYAYGSGCIGVSVRCSVCCKEGSVVSVCICVCVCVCVCMCVYMCVHVGMCVCVHVNKVSMRTNGVRR